MMEGEQYCLKSRGMGGRDKKEWFQKGPHRSPFLDITHQMCVSSPFHLEVDCAAW